jgi:hypothetical protein
MPARGYRDETKARERSIEESRKETKKLKRETKKSYEKINKLLAENPALGDGVEALARYQCFLKDEARFLEDEARSREYKARSNAAFGRERQLGYLVKIAVSVDRDGLTAHAASRKIADEMGGNARLRHANKKTLYRKFQRAPALYRRLALASEDPSDAAEREICEATGMTPRSELERQRRVREQEYRARLLKWAQEAPKRDELARTILAARSFKSPEEFARAYRAIHNILFK